MKKKSYPDITIESSTQFMRLPRASILTNVSRNDMDQGETLTPSESNILLV